MNEVEHYKATFLALGVTRLPELRPQAQMDALFVEPGQQVPKLEPRS